MSEDDQYWFLELFGSIRDAGRRARKRRRTVRHHQGRPGRAGGNDWVRSSDARNSCTDFGGFVELVDPSRWYSLEAAEAGEDWFLLTLRSNEYRDSGSPRAIEIEVFLPDDWEQCHAAAERFRQGFVALVRIAESYVELLGVDQGAPARLSGERVIARGVHDGACDE